MKIESKDQEVRDLLASGYFRIPRFQRPYSWTSENIQEFWDDVVRDNPIDYFIGSMVLFQDGKQQFGVVDGQQRLTTIIILLAALRNKLSALGFPDLAEGIQGQIERKTIDNKLEFILSSETSYPFLQSKILSAVPNDIQLDIGHEEENLASALTQCIGLLESTVRSVVSDPTIPEEKKVLQACDKLIAIRDALLSLKIIAIRLDNEDDAYIIFETLNTRGKDLSLADLVKNHLTKLQKAANIDADEAKLKWGRMLETIEGSSSDLSMDAFIHHYWLSRYEYLPAKDLFKVLKKQVTHAQAKKFLNDLVSDAELYRAIYEVEQIWTKQEAQIQDSLKALQLFRVQQQIPAVLSLVRAYKTDKVIKKKHVEEALLAIENFHFFFTAVTSARSSGGISAMYASLGRRLSTAPTPETAHPILTELRGKLRERLPSLEEVRVSFLERIVFTDQRSKQRQLVRYILRRLMQRVKLPYVPNYDQMTIEHLVPQNDIGTHDSEGLQFTDEVVGSLGNMVLVTQELNSKLSSKSFMEKKALFAEHSYSLPNEFKTVEKLTVKLIQQRTRALAEHAYTKVWKI